MKRSLIKRLSLCASVVLLLLAVLSPLHGIADFGDFGGDSDWGGSDWGGSSDWGDSDRDGRGGGGSPLIAFIIWGLLIFTIVSGLVESANTRGDGGTTGDNTLQDYIAKYDPNLNVEQLKLWIKKLYCDMQTGWEQGNITNVQDRFTVDAWNRFNNQLQMKTANHEVGHTRGIIFDEVNLLGVNRRGDKDVLIVRLSVRLNLWHTRDGEVVSNNPEIQTRMIYEWQMVRPVGVTTASEPVDSMHCPNCGKELDINAFAVCPFCGTQLARPGVTWALNNIKGLKQVTLLNDKREELPAETAARIEQEARDKGLHI